MRSWPELKPFMELKKTQVYMVYLGKKPGEVEVTFKVAWVIL